MTSLSQLTKHLCPNCDTVEFFDEIGCFECRKPYQAPVISVPVMHFNNQAPALAAKRLARAGKRERARHAKPALTDRQRKILALFGRGVRTSIIAKSLRVARETITTEVEILRQRFECDDLKQLGIRAQQFVRATAA